MIRLFLGLQRQTGQQGSVTPPPPGYDYVYDGPEQVYVGREPVIAPLSLLLPPRYDFVYVGTEMLMVGDEYVIAPADPNPPANFRVVRNPTGGYVRNSSNGFIFIAVD